MINKYLLTVSANKYLLETEKNIKQVWPILQIQFGSAVARW